MNRFQIAGGREATLRTCGLGVMMLVMLTAGTMIYRRAPTV